jgi:PilZ domain-containing protein
VDQPLPFEPERRRSPRLQMGIQVEFKRDGNDVPIRVQTTDIGPIGCYVEMSITLEVGSEVDAVIWLEGERIATRARVATCHPQFGNGFEFTTLSPADAARLAAFVNANSQQPQRMG